MATVPLVWRTQIAADIERAKEKLGPEALDVSYRFATNSDGEPSIFFRIVLAEWAAQWDQIPEATSRIRATLLKEIRAYENWGLWPYFNYETEAEWKQSEGRKS